jgi:hypothetical protein
MVVVCVPFAFVGGIDTPDGKSLKMVSVFVVFVRSSTTKTIVAAVRVAVTTCFCQYHFDTTSVAKQSAEHPGIVSFLATNVAFVSSCRWILSSVIAKIGYSPKT